MAVKYLKKLLFIIIASVMWAEQPIDFNLYKLDSTNSVDKPALLIMSGIQGDEPGAFNATSIFIKHYKIHNGNVWVVPNLNQLSILQNGRGYYGDMNRKFAHLDSSDPEYNIIQSIKELILDDNVVRIFHLHDGSGFYREKYINELANPNRWGNSSIIDQTALFETDDLYSTINNVIAYINKHLLDELHRYHIRNTRTAEGDKEMEKSLTYFAILNNKMAFANEASKNLPLNQRVYYHLLAIEGMLTNMDIEFERDFSLDLKTIDELINDKSMNIIINNIIELPLYNLKKQLNFFPMPTNPKENLTFHSNTPIVWLFEDSKMFKIKNGNRNLVHIEPFFTEFDYSLNNVSIIVDNEKINVPIGTIIKVKNSFSVPNLPYRVNIIGFQRSGIQSEVNINIKQSDLVNKFAINNENTKFRIEFYKQESGKADKFAGMIIADFSK